MASKYYILTLPANQWVFAPTYLPDAVEYMSGQLELGANGLLHWQFVVYLVERRRSSYVRQMYPSAHVEATKSAAARKYVHKEETRVDQSQFQIGSLRPLRNEKKDWDNIWTLARAGNLLEIPADIRIRCYSTLRRIEKDYMLPPPLEREVYVFYGSTGTGKSKRAWDEATWEAYPKDPNTKFWDGYQQQPNVVIDEFRGLISISNLLRWFDRYPVNIEVKGGACQLLATKIWITSNLPPVAWYPDLDAETYRALERRLIITRFDTHIGQ